MSIQDREKDGKTYKDIDMNLNNGKARIEQSGSSLSISILSKKYWLFLIFGIVWLVFWTLGARFLFFDLGGIPSGHSIFELD